MPQSTLSVIADQLRADLRQLREEVTVVNETLVRPTWEPHTHHYPVTLYGYMMAVFSRLDLYSQLWDGGITKNQTRRMHAFLGQYLPRDPLAHALAIKLWRHTLMHTSRPRRLRDRATQRQFEYLLHWGSPQLPREHHYRVANGTKLDIGLQYLLEDLDGLLEAYLVDLAASDDLGRKALEVWPGIEIQNFDV